VQRICVDSSSISSQGSSDTLQLVRDLCVGCTFVVSRVYALFEILYSGFNQEVERRDIVCNVFI
jgi:hypothetical protein